MQAVGARHMGADTHHRPQNEDMLLYDKVSLNSCYMPAPADGPAPCPAACERRGAARHPLLRDLLSHCTMFAYAFKPVRGR